jgi:hypothetical protein
MVKNAQKWSKMPKNGQKYPKNTPFLPPFLGGFGSLTAFDPLFLAKNGHF